MNFKEQALLEHTKENADYIVHYLVENPDQVDNFIATFIDGEYRVTQRLAWSLGKLAQTNHELLLPYLPLLINHIRDKSKHVAVRRNILRAMEEMALPEELHGIAYSQCFDALMDPKEPIAVKVFAMNVLSDIALIHKDLKNEVVEAILINKEGASAGYLSRSRKIVARLNKN